MAGVRLGRLKKRADFLRLNRGHRVACPGLVLQMAPNPDALPDQILAPRIGFTVTKKIGNAVIRNRVRRRLKAAAQAVMPEAARPSCDYVLIGRDGTFDRPFADLLKDLARALAKLQARRD